MNNVTTNHSDQKRILAEQLWLQYYNHVLFERGLITEEEHNRMINRINARNGMGNTKKSISTFC